MREVRSRLFFSARATRRVRVSGAWTMSASVNQR